MCDLVRRKRITDPLDADAKARLVGAIQLSYVSSGSEHSADDVDSPCLSELVHGFLEEEDVDDNKTLSFHYDSDSDRFDENDDDDSVPDVSGHHQQNLTDFSMIEDVVRSIGVVSEMDAYRNLLLSHVVKGMELLSLWRNEKAVYRRKVMSFLREVGHNAAICKTKWETSRGLSGGNYEFIDVVVLGSNRYIVDLDFASQFEIARPMSQYSKLIMQGLPKVFVGRNEELKKIIKVMSEAARRSMRARNLSVPPWRKHRYMQNKWLGPYRRTTNPLTSGDPVVIGSQLAGVKCRLVGFDDAVSSSSSCLVAHTR